MLMSTIANYAIYAIRNMNKAFVDIINPDADKPVVPLILTQPVIYNPKSDSSIISINPYNPRIINSGFYNDINKDKGVQKTLAKYYFYKIVDKWIFTDLFPLLAFVEIINGKPQLIKSIADYDVQKLSSNSDSDIELKAKYMEENIITKKIVKHVLKKICDENNINWYDLNKYEKKIKKIFYNFLLDKLKEAIGKYGKINIDIEE